MLCRVITLANYKIHIGALTVFCVGQLVWLITLHNIVQDSDWFYRVYFFRITESDFKGYHVSQQSRGELLP